jgi:hypothetical protein
VDEKAQQAAQALLDSTPPESRPCVLSGLVEDHGWCWVFGWTTEAWLRSQRPEDSPSPGYGPIAVDKKAYRASYLTSVYLPHAVELELAARRKRGDQL